MGGILSHQTVAGFDVAVHRALTEPILLGGAPRAVAIANGTLAAAVGLGLRLWIPGLIRPGVPHHLVQVNSDDTDGPDITVPPGTSPTPIR
jgi:type IV secretion system protein VirB3